jgi:hypothetical protein
MNRIVASALESIRRGRFPWRLVTAIGGAAVVLGALRPRSGRLQGLPRSRIRSTNSRSRG